MKAEMMCAGLIQCGSVMVRSTRAGCPTVVNEIFVSLISMCSPLVVYIVYPVLCSVALISILVICLLVFDQPL